MTIPKKTKANAGETLVEVVASVFIFLLMMGILQGAISYSSAAMEKNKKIRQENEQIISGLQSAEIQDAGRQSIGFSAVNTDMTVIGNEVFRISTGFGEKTVPYRDADGKQKTTVFYMYQPVQAEAGGGGQ